MESLKRENSRLQSQVDHQREQLSVCQQEIEESRTMLSQLEQLAQQVQNQNKSQNVSLICTYAHLKEKILSPEKISFIFKSHNR